MISRILNSSVEVTRMATQARFSINVKPRWLEANPTETGRVASEYYLIYMSEADHAYLQKLGLELPPNIIIPVVKDDITYTSPWGIGEEVRISVRTTRLGRSSLTLEIQFNEAISGRPIATI